MIFLGCDGGSTKTEWLLADTSGKVLAHRICGGCNYAFLGEDGFASLMTRCIREILTAGGVSPGDVTAAMFGLTVYGEVPGTETSIPDVLHSALPGCPVTVANDSVAGWGGSLGGRPGINVVAGTGSVAYGRDASGAECRVGGWSLFFADEGSCSWIARRMIEEFVKQADGRHPRSAIYKELRAELGLTRDAYFSGYLQTDVRKDSSLLAKLQPVALRAALQGDRPAQELYRRAAEELTEMAQAIRAQLDFPVEPPVTVSYSGGLFRAGETILNPLRACMQGQGFHLVPPAYAPIVGTIALSAAERMSQTEIDTLLAAVAEQL